MKKIVVFIFLLCSLVGSAQIVETVVRINGLQGSEYPLGAEVAARIIGEGSYLANAGLEVSGNLWMDPSNASNYYFSATPFFTMRGESGSLSGFVNIGPTFSFAYGSDLNEQRQSLDLGIHNSVGLIYRKIIFEYYYRIGFREYTYTNEPFRFSQLGFGLGYQF